ncbi:MAG: FecR domain-containing protein [Acidobacteriia bacterium]|nr:FecR domain-containing protein [Terriglobia bacterium]
MKPRRCFVLLALAAGIFSVLTASLAWAQGYSHARIVRLSFAEGDVTVERPDVQGWAQAPVNTPLQEGFRLSTGENSFAEVQFENGGTIRLGQLAMLDFTQLALTAGGGKINHVRLEQGYATFHARLDNGEDSYEVVTPSGTLTARDNTLFRVDLDRGVERVQVFKGAVDVASNIGTWALEKNSVLDLRPGASEPATLSQGVTKDDWDHWVEDRENRVETAQTGPLPSNYTGNTGDSLYGWSDLGEYGDWSYVPGWGYGWIPIGMAYGWAPYSVGRWCWYPGWGYTWISAEPWGWLPYHCGAWEFVQGAGWVWFPEACGMWSPALVTWYAGPDWIGWVPRPHPVHGNPTANPGAAGINWVPRPHPVHGGPTVNPGAAGARGGGAVVSTDTFRNGRLVDSASALGLNPSTGEKIDGPGIQPTVATMLPGPPVRQTPAQAPGRAPNPGNGVRPVLGITPAPGKTLTVKGGHEVPVVGAVAPAMPARRGGGAPPDSGIIYDPQVGRYENSYRVTPAQESPVARTGPTVTAAPVAKPGLVEPLPARSRDLGTHSAEVPGMLRPSPVAGARAATVAPAPGAAATRVDALPRGEMGVHAPSVSRGGPSVTPARTESSVSGGVHAEGRSGGGGGGQGHAGGTTTGGGHH